MIVSELFFHSEIFLEDDTVYHTTSAVNEDAFLNDLLLEHVEYWQGHWQDLQCSCYVGGTFSVVDLL